ncbi:hypothetical protein B0I27_109115 [Arcticibacter pallidicorallinus]|uniref:Uncharacterized protein n=1 Tax=Arcticibacter pallidicorallinus TaxID=1259464 RepID=A0A2T0TXJ3_9SPHI|nr:hypothetical protein [Arcticibacter pallidicorallinus]PRY50392.1 hypothetical protein B0I27_109115 [Arcticibacter pallidicorallinus]
MKKVEKKPSSYIIAVDYTAGFQKFHLNSFENTSLFFLRKSVEIELFSRIVNHKQLSALIDNAKFHDPADNVNLLNCDSDLLIAVKKAIDIELQLRNSSPHFINERAEKKDIEKQENKYSQLSIGL